MTSSASNPALLLHRPRTVRILRITNEAADVKSLTFKDELSAAARPGQFGMAWAPCADEMPMSLLPSGDEDLATITVKERGDGSRALLRKREGDLIGIRGPYGKGFTYSGEKSVLMIAGGTGAIPLLALLRTIVLRGAECHFILGANKARELLFEKEIERLATTSKGVVTITTDDGSAGTRGLATDEAARLLAARSFDRIYTCGPEIMIKRVVDLAERARIPAEAGLERIFKCGSGICGSCCIGPYLVCKDGPVFSDATLRELAEFGRSTRDASGRTVDIPGR